MTVDWSSSQARFSPITTPATAGNFSTRRTCSHGFDNDAVDEQQQLLHAFKITRADLDANRLGRLGGGERRRMLVACSVGVALGEGFGVWMLLEAVNSARTPEVEAQNWIIPAVIAVIVAAFTAIAARAYLHTMRRPVECVTGSVSIGLVRAGRSAVPTLEVAGRAFTLPRPPHVSSGVIAAYSAILTDRPYRVYVLGRRVLAMEPAPESLLDRAPDGHEHPVATGVTRFQIRLNWFSKACVAFLMLAALGLAAGGVSLGVVQFTGTPARATVTDCVADTDATQSDTSYDCTGTWVTGGSLVGGNGQVVVGTIDGVDVSDVDRTINVRLSGGVPTPSHW